MPNKCCVTGCKGNYATGPKVHIFSFPKDPVLLQKWVSAIPRKDWKPTPNTKVCQLHFHATDIQTEAICYDEKKGIKISAPLQRPRLFAHAIPSKFPNCPAYLSQPEIFRETPEERRTRHERENFEKALKDSIITDNEYCQHVEFSCFEELLEKVNSHGVSECWTVISKLDYVCFINLIIDPAPKVKCSVLINTDMMLSVHLHEQELKELGSCALPRKVTNINELKDILDLSESICSPLQPENSIDILNVARQLIESVAGIELEKEIPLKCLAEQLVLLCTKKERLKYSSDFLILSCLVSSISPHAYKFMRHSGNFILPHPSTIRKLCSSFNMDPQGEQLEKHFLRYIKEKFPSLKAHEHHVILLLDEIHLKPYFDFKGGNIVGMSFDSDRAASSAHVFMISSIKSDFKDVVHILPVKSINAHSLNMLIKKIILGLESIGFKVVCAITDNNSINRKAMSDFVSPPKSSIVYPHPADMSRPLFYLIDSVHILKCIRNNWLNQRNPGKCMFFPKFNGSDKNVLRNLLTASFDTLKQLYETENNELLKYGYGLTLKALSPTNMERQNVKLVLQIFNDHVINALMELGSTHDLSHFSGTAEYIKLHLTWWKIVNVNTPYKGIRLRDEYQTPYTLNEDDVKNIFLCKYMNWLDVWKDSGCQTGMLTKETHSALTHTTYALTEVANYCINDLAMEYVLFVKFQTDCLEEKFGKYRQIAGGQYNISIRQVFECEKKLRMQSILELYISSKHFGRLSVQASASDTDLLNSESENFENSFDITVTEADISKLNDRMPVLTYLAGYCAYAALKKLKCINCKSNLVLDKSIAVTKSSCKLILNLDRGGLLYPTPAVLKLIVYNYVVAEKLCSDFETDFLKVENQRLALIDLTIDTLIDEGLEICDCDSGHASIDVCKLIIWTSSNTLLNNYCKLSNEKFTHSNNKRRKLSTIQK